MISFWNNLLLLSLETYVMSYFYSKSQIKLNKIKKGRLMAWNKWSSSTSSFAVMEISKIISNDLLLTLVHGRKRKVKQIDMWFGHIHWTCICILLLNETIGEMWRIHKKKLEETLISDDVLAISKRQCDIFISFSSY